MSKSTTTRAEARPWYEEEVRPLGMGSRALESSWKLAWEAYAGLDDGPQADADRWRTWIRDSVDAALGGHNPPGLFLSRLKDPPADLHLVAKRPVKQPHGQPPAPAEYLDDLRRPPEPGPPMGLVFELNRHLGHPRGWNLVREEWERQGRPSPQQFDPAPVRAALEGTTTC